MKNHEFITSTPTPETKSPQEAALEKHKSKLIGFYYSGGKNEYIFGPANRSSQLPAIPSTAKETVLNNMRKDKNAYRDIEHELLLNIAHSNYPATSDDILDGIRQDKHQSKILADFTNVSWSNLDQLSGDNVASFLGKYPTPIDFEQGSEAFLQDIKRSNLPAKYDEYVKSMDEFCQQLYGKKYEYYKAMKALHEEAHDTMEPIRTRRQHRNMANFISSIFNKEHTSEKLVVDAGLASINKAEFTGATGRINEDAYYSDPANGLLAVFDGAGGVAGGARASNTAVHIMRQMIAEKAPADPRDLANIMYTASMAIEKDPTAGISTGLVGKILDQDGRKKLICASVGDSRAYIVRHGKAYPLTKDEGYGNIITNALGRPNIKVNQLGEYTLNKGDRIVFCSDGVTGDFEKDKMLDSELADIVSQAKTAAQAAEHLTRRAKKIDDRTALVFQV